MNKLLVVLVLMVSMGALVGCQQKQPDIIVVKVEKDFNEYDYAIGKILTRNIRVANKDYKYTVELENETGEVYSDQLFSIGEKVLIIEYAEDKVILIDLD